MLATAATALSLLAFGSPVARKHAQVPPAPPDSADRVIFWLDCDKVVGLTNAELDTWKSRGVDGFVCQIGHLRGLGGSQDFTGDPAANLGGANYSLESQLRSSNIVGRAAARGMKMYLGTYLVNYFNVATPLGDWFDDAAWSGVVLPKIRDLAAAAKSLGFAGLALDQELYPQAGNVTTASWNWNYPGNIHSEADVRAAATQRGKQVMSAVVGAFPGAELMAYDVEFPGTWGELVQRVVNGIPDAYGPRLDINFWDGMTSVDGYGPIRLMDPTFYKSPHLGTWDTALQYDDNQLYSYLSRTLSNWSYASSRVFLSPFSWIDPGPDSATFDDAHSPDYVKAQLLAFRKWGMGGEFANYVYNDNLRTFDYSPYVSALQEASTPAEVDPEKPQVNITSSTAGFKPPQVITGTAHDNLAIQAVRWHDDRGGSGTANLIWHVLSGDYNSGYVWQTEWSFPSSELRRGATQVTIAAEDIKGNTTVTGACADVKRGGRGRNRLRGTRQGDLLSGRGGNDKLLGRGGRDCLRGGRGADILKGGGATDRLEGGKGSDLLISRGGGRDVVLCGPGRHDRAIVDRRDIVRGCERVRRR